MPIPQTRETMLPILDVLADGQQHVDDEIQEAVARHFKLTTIERTLRLKNGIPAYKNRTAWGLVYLQDPKYLPDTRPYVEKIGVLRGQDTYKITSAGANAQRHRLLDLE